MEVVIKAFENFLNIQIVMGKKQTKWERENPLVSEYQIQAFIPPAEYSTCPRW